MLHSLLLLLVSLPHGCWMLIIGQFPGDCISIDQRVNTLHKWSLKMSLMYFCPGQSPEDWLSVPTCNNSLETGQKNIVLEQNNASCINIHVLTWRTFQISTLLQQLKAFYELCIEAAFSVSCSLVENEHPELYSLMSENTVRCSAAETEELMGPQWNLAQLQKLPKHKSGRTVQDSWIRLW